MAKTNDKNDEAARLLETLEGMNLEQARDRVSELISQRDALKNGTTDIEWARCTLNDTAADMKTIVDEGDHGTMKEKRMIFYSMFWDALLELFNEGGDIAFLCLNLRGDDDMEDLYWTSLAALVLSLFLRIFFCLAPNVRNRVNWDDIKKFRWWFFGTLTFLIEPNTGNRMIQKSFKDEEWQFFYDNENKRDDITVRAENELSKAIVERNTGFALVLVEDVPELIVEILYLTRGAMRGKEKLGPGFIVTTCGTVLHLLRQLIEGCLLHHKDMKKLRARSLRDKKIPPINNSIKLNKKVRSIANCARCELRQLDFYNCHSKLDEESLMVTANLCPNLTKIDLSFCSKTSDEGLKAIGRNCRHLTTISLRSCTKVTNNGIADLAAGCPNLTTIDLSGCSKITNEGIEVLVQKCVHLEEFYLARCHEIINESLVKIATKCPNVKKIYLEGCFKITDEGVKTLVTGCPNLKNISLQGCDVTQNSRELLSKNNVSFGRLG